MAMGLVDGRGCAPEACGELTEECRADADDHRRSTSTLMPEETTLPSTRSAMKAVLPKSPKGMRTKPASVVSLNSIRVTKKLHGEEEEGQQHQRPGEEEAGDLDEVLEEGDEAHEIGGGYSRSGRPASSPGLRDAAGAEQVRSREAGAGGQQPQACEALEDDRSEAVPVRDQESEDADEKASFSPGGR